VKAALAAGGRVVDESGAPGHRILSDPAGNRVCICAWPDGAAWPTAGDPSDVNGAS
jgi:4a-hydroxytetrahydrobiopterin dehydratase